MQVYSGIEQLPKGQASEKLTHGCICLEGGAFRGVYGEGVLDYLMEQDLNFDCVIGVSAGALNGLNYTAGQIGRSARINLRYRHDKRYVGSRAILKGHSILNLDFLFHEVEETDPLNKDVFYDERRRFIAVATNYLNGKTEYFEKGVCGNIFDAIKASASMPYITRPVEVDGIPCLDGGCSCKVPYQWAIDQGYEKIVVVRTRDRDYRKKIREYEDEKKDPAKRFYRHTPEFAKVLSDSNSDYNRQCEELIRLEKEGKVFVIAPSEPVTVGRVERDMEKLGELYYLGYHDMEAELDRLKEYLGSFAVCENGY